MTNRSTRYLLMGGAAVTAMFMVVAMFSGFRRLVASDDGGGRASGASRGLLDSTNKTAFAREAASRGDASAVPGLALCLRKDPDPAVRSACAEALGRLGDSRALPDLAVCLGQDPSPGVRCTAALALEASGMAKDARFFGLLEKRLAEDVSPAVRREIVGIMARLGTREAKRAISSRISDDDAGVREAVGQAFSAAGR
jgi:HEAT repeat protein